MEEALRKLKEFHTVFEINIEKKPVIPDKERSVLRQKLLEEELQEFKVAWESRDIVAVADALADLQYVLMGTVLEYGMQDCFAEIFSEVHRSNMSKLDRNGKALRRADGKVIKSEQYTPPEISTILNKYNHENI